MDTDKLVESALETGLNALTGGIGGTVLGWLTGNNKGSDLKRQKNLMDYQQKLALQQLQQQYIWNSKLAGEGYAQQEKMFGLQSAEQRFLRDTSVQSQVAGYDKSGLNRNLLSGSVGAGSSSSAPSPSASLPSGVSGGYAPSGILSSNRDFSVTEALQIAKLQAEIENIQADTHSKEADANLNDEKLKQEQIITRFTERFQIADLANVNQDWLNKITENQLLMKQVSKVDSEIKVNQQLVTKMMAETAVLNEEQKIKHAEAIVADKVWQERLKLIGAQVGWTEQQTKDLIVTLPYRLEGLSAKAALDRSGIEVNSKRARELDLICEGLGIQNYVNRESAPADIKKRKNEAAKAYHDARDAKTTADKNKKVWEVEEGHVEFRTWVQDFQVSMDVVETGTRAGKNVADAYSSVKGSLPEQMNAQTNRNNSQIHQYNAKTKRAGEYRKRTVAHQTKGVRF